jgi:glycosyltransferase involved in cell wall biosynthesis
MRIGIVTYALDRPLSGISRYTLELARALVVASSGLDLVLLTAGAAGPLAAQNRFQRVPLPGCRLWPCLVTLGNVMIPLRARLLELDLVHDPTGATPLFFRPGRARTVVTIHDVFPWSCPGTSTLLDTLIHRYWLPRVLPRVDAVITDSQASKVDIVRFLGIPAARIRVIYPGVNTAHGPTSQSQIAVIRSSHGLPGSYILFVGSIEKRKNLHGLLHAYARLRKMGETHPLVVVGMRRWRYTETTETLRELDLEQHVIFTGYMPDADLPALYSGADLFVFPSLYEGFGLPPLEAMACGTPVVCSNAASLPEVVGNAAITVDPHDAEGLAEAMHLVLTDVDLHEELREKGLERARQFTWERTARETVAVYREVCG